MPTEPLDADAVTAALANLPGWTGGPDGLVRTASLPTFPAAIEAVDRVAVVAEQADHHPDIDIRWRTLTFRLSTHDAGGKVSAKDVDLARRIEEILAG
jgi:4a-hydroxytetrahydrobiopterin dehydratase